MTGPRTGSSLDVARGFNWIPAAIESQSKKQFRAPHPPPPSVIPMETQITEGLPNARPLLVGDSSVVENKPLCRTHQGISSNAFPKHCGERIVSDIPDATTLTDEQKIIVNCIQRYSALIFLLGLPLVGEALSKSQEAPKPEAPSAEKATKISRKRVVVQPDDSQREAFERELSLAYPAEAPEPTDRRVFELRAAPTQIRQFDDKLIDVWAYNGQVPAPVLRVKLGEEVEVLLRNELPQPTTIHWHGMRVPNAMDGVPGVTQDLTLPAFSDTGVTVDLKFRVFIGPETRSGSGFRVSGSRA